MGGFTGDGVGIGVGSGRSGIGLGLGSLGNVGLGGLLGPVLFMIDMMFLC